MKKLVWLFGAWCLLLGGTVWAEEAAVLNAPSETAEKVKAVVNALNPSYETFWNWDSGEFSQGVSASLYTVKSAQIPVGSVRLGFGTNEILYGGAALDLPGICKRWLPANVKGIATTAPLDILWSVAGKYGRVALVGGYSFAEEEPAYGLTFGAALSF